METFNHEPLSTPFADDQIEWRVMRCGQKQGKTWAQLAAYVDARAIMNRLDKVMGPANWETKFREIQTPNRAGILCTLSLYIDGRWVSKEDGADFSRGIEITKSGISDSLKRTAVQWGIGRYLYTLPAIWAENIQDGYPPRETSGILISSKEHNIKAWCPRPLISMILPGMENRPTTKDELVSEVKRLIVNLHLKHRAASLKKHLNITDVKDLPQCSEEALAKYVKGLINLPATTPPDGSSPEGAGSDMDVAQIKEWIKQHRGQLPSKELAQIEHRLDTEPVDSWTADGLKDEHDKLKALLVA